MTFENYTIESYISDIEKKGLSSLWLNILDYLRNNSSSFFTVDNLGELYEYGLAYVDKKSKKETGVYYTPLDVSKVMGNYLQKLNGEIICDVCCGTGNLIIGYLSSIDRDEALNLLKNKRIYLYDLDSLALKICITRIGILLGFSYLDNIQINCCDFLNSSVHLPKNSKVISNPPYFKISKIQDSWLDSDIIRESKEYYSAFMEKILKESVSSVMITPFNFLGGAKFYSLRLLLNNYNGFILSFDNIPGSIFNGKKYGVFNSNHCISVRAAITVVENKPDCYGFRVSPLLRFSTEERVRLLEVSVLNSFIPMNYQIIDEKNSKYIKCFNTIFKLYQNWIKKSENVLADILVNKSDYALTVPNTCRYYVSATRYNLDRVGKHILYFIDEFSMEYAYCLLNSSFSYLYWRIYDGAITYTKNLLYSLPIFSNILTDEQKLKIHKMFKKMVKLENNYIVYKKNASCIQENVKFPEIYRSELNALFLEIMGVDFDVMSLEIIHSNKLF